MVRPLVLACALLAPAVARAQMAASGLPQAPARDSQRIWSGDPATKVAHAVRLQGMAPRVDARLDDPAWSQARFFDDFVMKEPVEGVRPTDRMVVGLLYDDDAIYVAARMWSADPSAIQRNVSRRDVGAGQSEHVWVSFDSFRDRRTAYSFGVTAAGVRFDFHHPRDHEYAVDESFDPVWDADARIDSTGWTAEMRIPFSQLRFRNDSVQVWGFNVDRWIASRNEDVFWAPVPRNVTAWSSRMGTLVGIAGVRPSRRIELLPYATANAVVASGATAADPFGNDGHSMEARAGGDLKMGLGPNVTVEATANPDFGQVDADPAVVNLTQFEVFFDERRPFFVEGSQLLRGNGPNYFYSRRIGAPPPGRVEADAVDRPDATTILGAAKVTGRLGSGLSIGALAAVTAREHARTYDSASSGFGRVPIAVPAGYGVLRLQQEFGRDRSIVGLMLTGVQRDLAGTPLESLQARQAFSGGLEWNLRFGNGWYALSGWAGFSRITGDSSVIAAQQRAPQRYFQRPDQRYVRYDPSRTSLSGGTVGVGLAKNSGTHWLWGVSGVAESPALELNDAGRLVTADGRSAQGFLTYREVRPGRLFRTWQVQASTTSEWNYGGDRQAASGRLDFNGTFLNRWQLTLTTWQDLPSQDERATRGGPSMGTPRTTVGIARLGSNFAASTQWNGRIYHERSEFGNLVYRLSGGLSFRPEPRFYFSATPNYLFSRDPRQYVATIADSTNTTTYGARYVFARVDQSQWTIQFRMNFAFVPDLTLEVYAEPFIASGAFTAHGELPAPRAKSLRLYGQAPGTTAVRDSVGDVRVTDGATTFVLPYRDFNVTSFRSNVVLRWEWRPGSTLYLVWQQDRGAGVPSGRRVRVGDLFDGLRGDGDNFFAVKVTYWLSVT
jgi:hypothetical protein